MQYQELLKKLTILEQPIKLKQAYDELLTEMERWMYYQDFIKVLLQKCKKLVAYENTVRERFHSSNMGCYLPDDFVPAIHATASVPVLVPEQIDFYPEELWGWVIEGADIEKYQEKFFKDDKGSALKIKVLEDEKNDLMADIDKMKSEVESMKKLAKESEQMLNQSVVWSHHMEDQYQQLKQS